MWISWIEPGETKKQMSHLAIYITTGSGCSSVILEVSWSNQAGSTPVGMLLFGELPAVWIWHLKDAEATLSLVNDPLQPKTSHQEVRAIAQGAQIVLAQETPGGFLNCPEGWSLGLQIRSFCTKQRTTEG